jgi:hypothetical protein
LFWCGTGTASQKVCGRHSDAVPLRAMYCAETSQLRALLAAHDDFKTAADVIALAFLL